MVFRRSESTSNNRTGSGGFSPRIPLSLQKIFLASNAGDHNVEPPTERVANKVFYSAKNLIKGKITITSSSKHNRNNINNDEKQNKKEHYEKKKEIIKRKSNNNKKTKMKITKRKSKNNNNDKEDNDLIGTDIFIDALSVTDSMSSSFNINNSKSQEGDDHINNDDDQDNVAQVQTVTQQLWPLSDYDDDLDSDDDDEEVQQQDEEEDSDCDDKEDGEEKQEKEEKCEPIAKEELAIKTASTTAEVAPTTNTNATTEVLPKVPPQVFLDDIMHCRGYSTSKQKTLESKQYIKSSKSYSSIGSHYSQLLIDLAKAGNDEELQQVLNRETKSSHAVSSNGESIIHIICRYCHDVQTLKLVLDKMNNQDSTNNKKKHDNSNKSSMKSTTQHYASCLQVSDDYGRTPLHYVCWRRELCFEMVDFIIMSFIGSSSSISNTNDDYNNNDNNCAKMFSMVDMHGSAPLSYVQRQHWEKWVAYLNSKKDIWWKAKPKKKIIPSSPNVKVITKNNNIITVVKKNNNIITAASASSPTSKKNECFGFVSSSIPGGCSGGRLWNDAISDISGSDDFYSTSDDEDFINRGYYDIESDAVLKEMLYLLNARRRSSREI